MIDLTNVPWEKASAGVPLHLTYRDGSLYEAVNEQAKRFPKVTALNFMHSKINYKKLIINIKKTAAALTNLGIGKGDHVLIAMPNCPQGIYAFYACSYIGAVAYMIHPLSAEKEILFYLNDSKCKLLITINAFFKKFYSAFKESDTKYMLIADIKDALNPIMKLGFYLTSGRKIAKVPTFDNIILWKNFIKNTKYIECNNGHNDDTAVVLYSGGTTGVSKGIALTNYNFNALATQVIATNPMFRVGDKMLAAMPLFHGFGLGVCVHSMLASGGCSILVPRFTADTYSKLTLKYRCNFIAGVPTLFEALTRTKCMSKADLSCLKGVFSGGDSLSIVLKKKFDKFLKDHNSTIQIREGYGTTECVTACCLTPVEINKEGSIGIPFPDTYFKIVKPNTMEELAFGEEGEIIISGPTVMKEYINHPHETNCTLTKDDSGRVWLHTGDLGTMDDEGFVYFKGRIKRLIITSGYNVYPAQLENVLEQHESVQMSCIIGVKDDYKMNKVKGFVVLKKGFTASKELKENILNHCKKYIPKYAMPYDIEFRESLPTTLVGKVAYRVLEEEENSKN